MMAERLDSHFHSVCRATSRSHAYPRDRSAIAGLRNPRSIASANLPSIYKSGKDLGQRSRTLVRNLDYRVA